MLHMEIIRERLEREYNLELLITAPSVEYHVFMHDGSVKDVENPSDLPSPGTFIRVEEPWVDLSIIAPSRYIGPIMELVQARRGSFGKMEYVDEQRVLLTYQMPLAELIVDFYDQLKTRTQGYASLDYHFAEYRPSELVKLDVLVNGQPVDALSMIIHQDKAYHQGRTLIEKLRTADPAPDVRRAAAGRDRRQDHRPRDDPGHAQERAGQVLRRRRQPQAQAAGEAGRGQKAHEAGRPGRDPPGSLHGRPVAARLSEAASSAHAAAGAPNACVCCRTCCRWAAMIARSSRLWVAASIRRCRTTDVGSSAGSR